MKCWNFCPIGGCEFKRPDSLSRRGEEDYRAEGSAAMGEHVQRGPFCAFEDGFRVDKTLFDKQLGP